LAVTIAGADDAPVAVPITAPAGTVGRPFGPFTFAPFTDVDNAVLTYTVTGLPPGVTFDPATRTFSGTPTEFGAFTITVTGSDGVLSASTSFTLRVYAPPVNTLPNGTITVRGDPVRFVGTDGSTFKVADPDSTDLTVRLTAGVGLLTLPQRAGVVLLEGAAINDQTVVIRGPIANLNAALAQLVYQAPTGYIGTDTITIVSTDEQGNSDTDVTNPPISIVLSTLGGNDAAAAIGCMMAGVTVVAWYPITPSSSLCESLIGYMKKYRMDKKTGKATFAIVQAEDEIASLGMVIGASWAGARSMTATRTLLNRPCSCLHFGDLFRSCIRKCCFVTYHRHCHNCHPS